MSDIVGSIPEFTTDESVAPGVEEVKQPVVEETPEQKETAELPADQKKPVDEKVNEDTVQPEIPQEVLDKAVERATTGLRSEIVDLRTKLATATGNDRKLIKQDIVVAQEKLDELADVNPADIALIEKVIKSKGYVSKDELGKITYEQVKTQTLNTFLEKYPEYKPENDPNDINWKALQKELSFYRMPDDPAKITEILERSHKTVHPVVSDLNIPAKKRSLQVASAGAGGVQKSSSNKTLSSEMRRHYEDGGWTKEEIDNIEKSL